MIKEMTINDATHKWVGEFNAIPQGMIERLMRAAPDEWEELTLPRAGSRVHVFDLPDSCDTREHLGEIVAYAADLDKYRVDLDGGPSILVEPDNLEVVDEDTLPMWGTMWSFGDSCDNYWLEYADGIRVMSDCGFRIYRHEVRLLQRALDSALQKAWIAVARPRRRKSRGNAQQGLPDCEARWQECVG